MGGHIYIPAMGISASDVRKKGFECIGHIGITRINGMFNVASIHTHIVHDSLMLEFLPFGYTRFISVSHGTTVKRG